MIYIDSSVALAYLLSESRAPSPRFMDETLVSSRLLEYEVWNRLHAREAGAAIQNSAQQLLSGIELIDMSQDALRRALSPWPTGLRTLDSLHLATAEFLRTSGESIELASYDNRLLGAAQTLGIPAAAL